MDKQPVLPTRPLLCLVLNQKSPFIYFKCARMTLQKQIFLLMFLLTIYYILFYRTGHCTLSNQNLSGIAVYLYWNVVLKKTLWIYCSQCMTYVMLCQC